ncbi:DNA replication complex subunit Gins51 [[Eubacterium] cellulosolvens]
MYQKLYETWRREVFDKDELQQLEQNFFDDIGQYLKELIKEIRMLDNKTVKYRILNIELEKAQKLTLSIIEKRTEKILGTVFDKRNISQNHLSNEEIEIYETVTKIKDQYENMKTVTLEGKSIDLGLSSTKKCEKILIRFMTKIPLIVGVDMENYGPFEPEDIATLPRENAEALIRQKAAIEIRI